MRYHTSSIGAIHSHLVGANSNEHTDKQCRGEELPVSVTTSHHTLTTLHFHDNRVSAVCHLRWAELFPHFFLFLCPLRFHSSSSGWDKCFSSDTSSWHKHSLNINGKKLSQRRFSYKNPKRLMLKTWRHISAAVGKDLAWGESDWNQHACVACIFLEIIKELWGKFKGTVGIFLTGLYKVL